MQLTLAALLCCVALAAAGGYGGDDAPAPAPAPAPAQDAGYGGGGGYGATSGGAATAAAAGYGGGKKMKHQKKMGGGTRAKASAGYGQAATTQAGYGQKAQSSYGQASRGYGAGAAQVAQAAEVQQVSAVEAANAAIDAAVAQGANRGNFGVQTNARYTIATSKNAQNPVVWDALNVLRGKDALSMEDILNLMYSAVPGQDFPVYNDIPNTGFSCESVKQAGFYADTEAQCQVIRRCDINGVMWSYLCPNMTLFNQITLVCDWFYNIDCSKAKQFYDYSNPRLYTDFVLLDDGEATMSSGGGYGMRPAQPSYNAQPSYKPAKPAAPKPQAAASYGPAPVAPVAAAPTY